VNSSYGTTFYIQTGFHGAHVAGGVIWLLVVLAKAFAGTYTAENYMGVEIFGLYWHFVDLVWILLFTIVYLI
jgi:heme/copper-type cytochrome/quinol oxidase subunit 3